MIKYGRLEFEMDVWLSAFGPSFLSDPLLPSKLKEKQEQKQHSPIVKANVLVWT